MRNENAAALDSESRSSCLDPDSRISCLDPDSRISCRMQELVSKIRFIWRPEKISSISRWLTESDGETLTVWWQLTSRQLASASSHRRARCSVLEIPHRLPTNSFAKVGRAFLYRTDSWVCSTSACCVDGEISCASSFHVLLYVILCLQRIAGCGGVGWSSGRAPSEGFEHSPGIRIASVGRWSWWVALPGNFLKRRNLEIFQLLSVTGVNSFSEVGILGAFKCLPGGGGEFWMSKMSRLQCWEGA